MRIDTNTGYIPNVRLTCTTSGVVMSVDMDDPVYAVQESYAANLTGEDHRWQILYMPEGDLVMAFWTDLGPASDFRMVVDGDSYPVPMYQQPVLLEHTVGECLAMVEASRADDYAVKILNEQTKDSTLLADYEQMVHEDMLAIRNASTFGRGGSVQRSGYSRVGAKLRQEKLNGI